MSHRRFLFFWLMVLVSAALAVWWIITVPYSPRHLYRPIPARSIFVTANRDLAGRWNSFSKNPLTLSLLSSLGIKPADLQKIGEDAESARWLKRLASHDVALAYVQGLGEIGKPGWVFVSWLGGDSQCLRWSLLLRRPPGFIRMKPYRGRLCWIVKDSVAPADEWLTITFVEGMLIGCLSSDPFAIHETLDTYDGILPSLADNADFPSGGPWCAHPQAADRGWVNLTGSNLKASFEQGVFSFECTALTSSSVVGQVCGKDPFHFLQTATTQAKSKGLENLVDNLPLGIGLISSQMALPLMEERNSPAWLRIFGEVIRDQHAESIAVVVLGEEFSGRMKGIKVPTIITGIPVRNASDTLAWMRQALDRLNAKYHWGLIPRQVDVNGDAVFAVEHTASDFFSTLTLEEKPAFTICGEWLLLSSNLEGLRNLLARFRQMPVVVQNQQTWWKRELDSIPTPCFVRIDLTRGGKMLRLALTTYGLKLLLADATGTLSIRQRLNEVKAWIDSLTPLQTCRFWLRSDGQMMQIQFKAGE